MRAPLRPGGRTSRLILIATATASAYILAARLGFHLAFVAEQVTTVWAPTGIAQAALLLWGRRLWPAVWTGAFVANAWTAAPLWTAGLIATGNTLEALAASWVLGRTPAFHPGLARTADAVRFIIVAALLATAISASLGVTALCLGGVQPWTEFRRLWAAWWLGDALGALVVAPVILTAFRPVGRRSASESLWAVGLLLISAALAAAVFGRVLGPGPIQEPVHYLVFPLVVIAAVRFGQPATALVVFGASAVTIWHTVRGSGPFASADVHQGLVLLQVFMGVLATTGLLLAAALVERRTSERRRAAAHAAGEVLADAGDLVAASPDMLRIVCEHLELQIGGLWLVDEDNRRLRCVAAWSGADAPAAEFVRGTRRMRFTPGAGLPGRAWATGSALWTEDVQRDPAFLRAEAARDAGVHGAVALPIRLGSEVLGVLEFFTRRAAVPDAELLETVSTICNQVAQFVARKRAEAVVLDEQRRTRAVLETVRVSEERFRSLAASNSALTLYEHDRELRYRWVFPQHPEFPENIGKTDVELLPGGEGQRLYALKRRVLETGVGAREEVTVALPTEIRSYDLMVEPRRDGSGAVVGVSGVAVDITERKRSEQLLLEHKNALELVAGGHPADECFRAVAGAIPRLCAHAGACVLVVNDVRATITVWHAADMPASFADGLSALLNGGTGLGQRVIQGHAAGSRDLAQDRQDDEWPVAGRELFLAHGARACHFEPAFGRDGNVVGSFMLWLGDARAPNAWERRVAEFGAHIASIVVERERAERAVRASEDRLREADRRKDEFIAMLAHELRNPLAPIRTGLELVRLGADTPAAFERVRSMMERQVGHMVRLIDDLLDVSRITSGKIHLQKRPGRLSELINGAVEANRTAIQAAGLELSVQLPGGDPLVVVDPTRFVQVLSNLLHNASKFTERGGNVTVGAEVARHDDGDELVVRVADTGIGIPADLLPRVFDLFMQGERSLQRSQPGLGIGLALARQIVEMHGGRLDARSAGPGRGSEFTIRMPLRAAPAGGPPPGDAAPVAPREMNRRVLIIDDNVDAADTLAALVRALGGEARTAGDGAGGIECASEFMPDVILLDIGMPDMDGYETCRRLRERSSGARPLMIALTGWGQEEDRRRAMDAGFDAHLTKPADPVALEALLASAPTAAES